MQTFSERIAAAPTHVAYFTRGGGNVLITQTMGTVVETTGAYILIESAATDPARTISIPTADLLARKDGGERLTEAEWDAIFAEHGHEQRH